MENEASSISERELAEKIRFLKNQGLGYRRIGKQLEISKDRAFRLDHKYKTAQKIDTEQEITDQELAKLGELEKDAWMKTEIARKKRQKRWNIASLLVQQLDADFQARQQLFKDKKKLLAFAKKTIPEINPTLWLLLNEFCEAEKIDVADALKNAVGPQTDYEDVRMQAIEDDDEYYLDEYFCDCLKEWLLEKQKVQLEKDIVLDLDIVIKASNKD